MVLQLYYMQDKTDFYFLLDGMVFMRFSSHQITMIRLDAVLVGEVSMMIY